MTGSKRDFWGLLAVFLLLTALIASCCILCYEWGRNDKLDEIRRITDAGIAVQWYEDN